ncbi:hypothetical protein [Brachybacterium epidermidis]|uniref:hypothetical protein n=1 Tax=Brachybacterium epidermidis TaxID=2781983 RepID=UPI00398EBF48
MTNDATRVIGEMFAYLERDEEMALAWVESLRRRGDASKHRAVAFRCRKGCSMLEVYPTPRGVIVYRPRYRLSPTRNAEQSSAEGRAANTEDGDRRWKAHAGFLPTEWEGWTMPLACDHAELSISADAISTAVADGKRAVICE